MYLPKGKTKKTEEDTMETKITTAEKLAMELYGCMNSAVLDYGDYTRYIRSRKCSLYI